MTGSIILILVVLLLIILAGLFSGAEIGMYQISRLRLRLGIEKKKLSFVLLGRTLRDRQAFLLSMLTGTNLAHYLATSIITILLLSRLQNEHTAELSATALTAPVLFVFSELIPKNIFFYRADVVMPRIAPFLFLFHKFFNFCAIVPLLKSLSRIFARLVGSRHFCEEAIPPAHQPYIKAILQETHEEAFLSPVQTDIMNRLAEISHLTIKSVMTPVSETQPVDVNSGKSLLLDILGRCAYTRLPVYERQLANFIGFINIYDCLSSEEEFDDLRSFVEPIRKLSADTTVPDAISIMQNENQKIVLVTRTGYAGRQKPIGIVTMKDLVEELLGELAEW